MADTKISALTAATSVAAADQLVIVQSATSKVATGTMARGYLTNGSTATVSAGYAVDTYLAGSSIVIPVAGGWKVGTIYQCLFDMTKTGAGTAAFTINLRIGTAGTTADPSLNAFAFGAGTANADTGFFTVTVVFRTNGASGTTAAIVGCQHSLAATGLISNGASGFGTSLGTAGPTSLTTQTTIGISVNGGASFSGTNTLVQAQLYGF